MIKKTVFIFLSLMFAGLNLQAKEFKFSAFNTKLNKPTADKEEKKHKKIKINYSVLEDKKNNQKFETKNTFHKKLSSFSTISLNQNSKYNFSTKIKKRTFAKVKTIKKTNNNITEEKNIKKTETNKKKNIKEEETKEKKISKQDLIDFASQLSPIQGKIEKKSKDEVIPIADYSLNLKEEKDNNEQAFEEEKKDIEEAKKLIEKIKTKESDIKEKTDQKIKEEAKKEENENDNFIETTKNKETEKDTKEDKTKDDEEQEAEKAEETKTNKPFKEIIYYKPGSNDPKADIINIVETIYKNTKEAKDYSIIIHSFYSEDTSSTSNKNWLIAFKRLLNFRKTLIEKGLINNNMDIKVLKDENKELDSNRIEIEIK